MSDKGKARLLRLVENDASDVADGLCRMEHESRGKDLAAPYGQSGYTRGEVLAQFRAAKGEHDAAAALLNGALAALDVCAQLVGIEETAGGLRPGATCSYCGGAADHAREPKCPVRLAVEALKRGGRR